jgi:predicted PurR-regulated permease PerM
MAGMAEGEIAAEGVGRRNPEAVATDFVVRLGLLGLFAWWSLSIVAPFLVVVVWAIILAVALNPLHARLRRVFGSLLASLLITLALLALLVVPAALVSASAIESLEALRDALARGALVEPPLLERLAALPMVGAEFQDFLSLASTNGQAFMQRYGGELLAAGGVIVGTAAGLAGGVLAFTASIVVSGFLYAYGPALAAGGRRLAVRVVGRRGEGFVDLAGATVRGVARGVIGVALIQTLLFGAGIWVAGVPHAGLIALATLVLAILQVGGAIPTIGVLIWAWTSQETLPALLLTVYLVPVGFIDNVLKPVLMSQGLPTPMLVILIGLIGGTLSYGLIGLFLGPIVLAVFYDLVVEWVRAGDAAPAEDRSGIE